MYFLFIMYFWYILFIRILIKIIILYCWTNINEVSRHSYDESRAIKIYLIFATSEDMIEKRKTIDEIAADLKYEFNRATLKAQAQWHLTGSRQLVSGCKWRQPRNLWHRLANSFTPTEYVTELCVNVTLTQIGMYLKLIC